MRQGTPISVFIIARDEADRIATAIDSVAAFAAEVVVIDSGSEDDTVAVAESRGARVLFNPWPGYGPQKRFGEEACAHDWVLNLDADEEVTPALAAEIAALRDSGRMEAIPFWRIDIKDVFPHERSPAPWAYGHTYIRLYDRRAGRFSASTVHDTVRPPEGARTGRLRHVMAHRSTRSVSFQVEKMNRYSTLQAEDFRRGGRRLSRWRLLFEFPLAFLKAYVLRRYALYGGWGLVMATGYAYSRFLRIAKIYEAELARTTERTG